MNVDVKIQQLGWQGHQIGEVCRFHLNTCLLTRQDEYEEVRILVSTVGMRIDVGSREVLPLFAESGFYFETAIFHADDGEPPEARVGKSISTSCVTQMYPDWKPMHGTGFDLVHQQAVTASHFVAVDAVYQLLTAGNRLGKIPNSQSLGYDW